MSFIYNNFIHKFVKRIGQQAKSLFKPYECRAVYDKGRCGFTLRVEAGRCGSNRFNADIDTELEYWQNIFEHDPKSFFRRIVVTESSGIDTGYDAGETGSMRF
jgi:hypothetical protein